MLIQELLHERLVSFFECQRVLTPIPTPNIQKSLSHMVSAKQTIQKSLNMLSGIM
jgi:hypothetical protein